MKHNLETLTENFTKEELEAVKTEVREMMEKHSPNLQVNLHTILKDILDDKRQKP